jgi:hypothetical protein
MPGIAIRSKNKITNLCPRSEKTNVVALRKGLASQEFIQKTFTIVSDVSYALQGSYLLAHLLAKENKPVCNGEFARKYLQHIVQENYPEK